MLAVRSQAQEQMDADDLDAETYAAVVHDLARVNTLTLARRPTLAFLDTLLPRATLSVLDVGFGDGDMLRAIHRWGHRRGVALNLTGIDLNSRSVPAARDATPEGFGIDYRTGDYANLAGGGFDVILSSLVAHHMTPSQLVAFLRFMESEARVGWFLNDLHRNGFAYLGYPVLARLMRWHRIVREDGQLSIARSFRCEDWLAILAEARITEALIKPYFPFRLCVARTR